MSLNLRWQLPCRLCGLYSAAAVCVAAWMPCNDSAAQELCAVLCLQDMNEVLMLDMENSGGYDGVSPRAGARFTFADRSGSTLPHDSLDAAAQIAEVMSESQCFDSSRRHPTACLFPTQSRSILS